MPLVRLIIFIFRGVVGIFRAIGHMFRALFSAGMFGFLSKSFEVLLRIGFIASIVAAATVCYNLSQDAPYAADSRVMGPPYSCKVDTYNSYVYHSVSVSSLLNDFRPKDPKVSYGPGKLDSEGLMKVWLTEEMYHKTGQADLGARRLRAAFLGELHTFLRSILGDPHPADRRRLPDISFGLPIQRAFAPGLPDRSALRRRELQFRLSVGAPLAVSPTSGDGRTYPGPASMGPALGDSEQVNPGRRGDQSLAGRWLVPVPLGVESLLRRLVCPAEPLIRVVEVRLAGLIS